MSDVVIAAPTAVTATGVVGSAASVASFTDDFDLAIEINSMTSGVARIAVEESTDGSTWTTVTTLNVSGALGYRMHRLRSYALPSIKVGVTSAQLRLNVTVLTASTITVGATLKDV